MDGFGFWSHLDTMVVPVRANVVYGIEKAPIKDWKPESP